MTTTKLNTKQLNDYGFASSIFRQALINPNCQVNQLITAVNLTSGKLFGPVDMFYAKGAGTAVSAGTITQSTSASVGNSGYALLLSGVTLTGTGKIHVYTFIESLNAKLYKNKTGSFSVKVYHDVGSAINYVIKINKANSADNFSAVTNIATANAQSVPNTTETLIKFENVSLGDCSNGIEIEVEADCGAITTKNFQYTDWQFNEGSVVLPFCCRDFGKELIDCMRIWEKSFDYATTPGNVTYNTPGATQVGGLVANNRATVTSFFKVSKRVAPVITTHSSNASSTGTTNMCYDAIQLGVGESPLTNGEVYVGINSFIFESSGLGVNNNAMVYGWVANARPTIA